MLDSPYYQGLLAACAAFLILTGCSSLTGAPNCSDTAVTDLVVQIAKREMVDRGIATQPQVAQLSVEVSAIRTDSKNEEARKCECAASMHISRRASQQQEFPITYTAQYTEDNQVYVEVFGL